MPAAQPRDRDGRYARSASTPPSAAPHTPSRPQAATEPGDGDTVSRAYRLFSAQPAPTAPVEDPDHVWARTYHTRFRRFDQRTLTATRALLGARPSQMTPQARADLFTDWVNQISGIYRMDPPAVLWDATADNHGGGFYRASTHSITMSPNRPSVITLMHETRHALQRAQAGAPMVSTDVERDARAWSLSLYYRVRPALFRRLVRDGRVLHIDTTVFGQ